MAPRDRKAVTKRNRQRNAKPQRATVTRTKGPDALPEGLRDLRGAEKVTRKVTRKERRGTSGKEDSEWETVIKLPGDLADFERKGIDPLIPAHGVASAIRGLQERLEELVQLARRQGHSWTRIGEALGMTRQAAWDKYSGEE